MKARIVFPLGIVAGLALMLVWAVTIEGQRLGERARRDESQVLLSTWQQTASIHSAPGISPTREVVVAIGSEPDSLYVYGTPRLNSSHILNALMDGPITERSFDYQPVILTKIPRLEDGDAVIEIETVGTGVRVVDDNGSPVTLTVGSRVRPAGCYESACAVVFDGPSINMDRMLVTFTLRGGVRWSDGAILKTQDSAFGFQMACHPDTPSSKYYCERTATYDTPDDLTAHWVGLPGYRDSQIATKFWTPLPRHVLSTTTPLDILNGPYARHPLGWGPFRMVEWVVGDHITVERNPYYWRPGYPKLDRVTFRWYSNAAALRGAFLRGDVQVITQDAAGWLDIQELQDWQDRGAIQVLSTPGTVWEHLDFGLLPADGRYAFFADKQVRQAVAYALDRQRIIDQVHYGLVSVPNTYVPENHPAYPSGIRTYAYNPTMAANLLTSAGWVDANGDGIRDKVGQSFVISLTTTTGAQRQKTGRIIQENLSAVGISVTLDFRPGIEAFLDGPDGPIFGRKFDLAEFAWLSGMDPPCHLYLGSEIPGEWNSWGGVNVTGYSNMDYDQVCNQALSAIARSASIPFYQQVMMTLAEDLPMLPLQFRYKLAAADLAINPPLGLDPTESSELWNIWDWGITNQTSVAPTASAVLTGSGGRTTVDFPMGTFGTDPGTPTVVVTYTPQLPVAPGGSLAGIGLFYDLQAVSQTTGQPVQPQGSYTVTLSYIDEMVQAAAVEESTLALFFWDGQGWVKEPNSQVDTAGNTITATPDHLSRWAVLGETKREFLPVVMSNQ